MKKFIFYFIIISFIFTNENSSTLVLYPSSSIDSSYIDKNDIETINSLFIDGLNQYINNIEILDESCAADDCALEKLSQIDSEQIIYTRLQKLGSKIIFSASAIDINNSFKSKVTAMSIEDMENACLRLSKSIALRQTLEESADVDNITEKEEEESARRKSIGRIGMSIGYLFPNRDLNYKNYDWDDSYTERTYSQMFKYSLNYYSEFNNNTALLAEMALAFPITSLDLNFIKFQNKIDTSPFYGGGIGFYTVTNDDQILGGSRDSGLALNLQAGVLLYRTYDVNVIARVKYFHIFNENSDAGLILDIGFQWKRSETRTRRGSSIWNLF